ncbi:MAG TPA: ABC transporter substrate-binding protein [Candidatus Xenobia bacterium]|jgi:iron complex transport system substrate-binding protein
MLLVLLCLLLVVPSWAGPVALRDGLGRPLVLLHRPVRIVSLTPSVTEMLYALKLQDRIVGVTSNDDYPPEVKLKPKVGDWHPDYERLIELHPDLVVMEGRLAPSTLETLDRLHLPTLALDSSTVEGFHTSVRLVGQATGASVQAQALLRSLDARMAAVDAKEKALPASARPRVFIEIGEAPLQTAGKGTFIDELVRRAGGDNCYGNVSGYPQVDPEQLLARRPAVAILTTSTVAAFKSRPGCGAVKAYSILPPDSIVRPGPRMADGLELLYDLLHRPATGR